MRLALIKLEAEKELDPSYAGLYALNEGLHSLGHLNDKDYEIFKKRYSDKLVNDTEQEKEEISPQAQKEIENMTRYFAMVVDQWHLHQNSEWRSKQLQKAKQYVDRIPTAKIVLSLQ